MGDMVPTVYRPEIRSGGGMQSRDGLAVIRAAIAELGE